MKGQLLLAATFCLGAAASAQMLDGVHRRDDYNEFKLKRISSESTVYGPIVFNKTVYTFKNPYKSLVEAAFDFSIESGAALNGFAYWYKKEKVKGVLMDKKMAWFIYTAITSRDRDPGIMDMVSPTDFHAQIYPLAIGHDLRLELTTINYLIYDKGRFKINRPDCYDSEKVPASWKIHGVNRKMRRSSYDGTPYVSFAAPKATAIDVWSVAQKGPKDRYYVVGLIRGNKHRVPTVKGLSNPVVSIANETEGQQAYQFSGWTHNLSNLKAYIRANSRIIKPKILDPGRMCSKLWAANYLANHDWKTKSGVLKFSLYYQVPSSQTALLAVPRSERKLFDQKRKEYLRNLAKEKLEMKRQGRKDDDSLNNDNSRGGDPELRINAPEAKSVYAKLPDGRVLTLRKLTSKTWGANFEIPTDSPDGSYTIKVHIVEKDGSVRLQAVNYRVDRKAPNGTMELAKVDGKLIVRVYSQPGLREVAAFLADGRKIVLKEVRSGVYEGIVSDRANRFHGAVTVLLKDRASNKTEIRCDWP